jgi:hypothetical protein
VNIILNSEELPVDSKSIVVSKELPLCVMVKLKRLDWTAWRNVWYPSSLSSRMEIEVSASGASKQRRSLALPA